MTMENELNVHCVNHFDAIEGLHHCARCGRSFCNDCVVTIGGLPYCATCKAEQVMDVQSGVDPLRAQYASLLRRFAALVVDSIVVGIPMQIFSGAMNFAVIYLKQPALQFTVMGAVILLSMIITIAYEALMILRNGQTVGKMALQIKVVRADGGPVAKREAWIRPVVRAFTAILCLADYFAALFTKEKTCIHDMAAGTRVVNV